MICAHKLALWPQFRILCTQISISLLQISILWLQLSLLAPRNYSYADLFLMSCSGLHPFKLVRSSFLRCGITLSILHSLIKILFSFVRIILMDNLLVTFLYKHLKDNKTSYSFKRTDTKECCQIYIIYHKNVLERF